MELLHQLCHRHYLLHHLVTIHSDTTGWTRHNLASRISVAGDPLLPVLVRVEQLLLQVYRLRLHVSTVPPRASRDLRNVGDPWLCPLQRVQERFRGQLSFVWHFYPVAKEIDAYLQQVNFKAGHSCSVWQSHSMPLLFMLILVAEHQRLLTRNTTSGWTESTNRNTDE